MIDQMCPKEWNMLRKAEHVIASCNSLKQISVAKKFVDRVLRVLSPFTRYDSADHFNEDIRDHLLSLWRIKIRHMELMSVDELLNGPSSGSGGDPTKVARGEFDSPMGLQ